MNLADSINEMKYCTALMLRAYGDHSKVLSYYLVKSLDFYDPKTDPMEVLTICGYMLETIRLMIVNQMAKENFANNDKLVQEEIQAELADIQARPFLSENFSIKDYETYKQKTLNALTKIESRAMEKVKS